MEEYNRQMEEYNRQLEEYNRRLAQQSNTAPSPTADAAPAPVPVAEAEPASAPAPVAEPAPAPAPAPASKPAISRKRIGGLAKKPAAAPAAPAAPADEAEEGLSAEDEMLLQLQAQTAKKPIYKTKLFMIACSGLALTIGICIYLVVQHNAANQRMLEQNARVAKVQKRAREINKSGIECLKDAKKKNITIEVNMEDVQFSMDVIVHPDMKGVNGMPMFGNQQDGAAQLACLYVAICCEADPNICKSILDRMSKEAPIIKPAIYRWLLQRLAVADIPDINQKLRTLADEVAANPTTPFRTRNEQLSYIWEAMGLRVSQKDISPIAKLLNAPDVDSKVAGKLLICLDNIVRMIKDPDKRAKAGDKMFDALSDDNKLVARIPLATSCSPKALEFFCKRADDSRNWQGDAAFFANYGNDDVLPFIKELMQRAKGDAKQEKIVLSMITGLFTQNHDRTLEQANDFIALIPDFDKINDDTSDWQEVNDMTDENAQTFVKESDPKYPALKERIKELNASRDQKLRFIKVLSGFNDYAWVCSYLERFSREPDRELASTANRALEQVKKNRAAAEEQQAKYDSRTSS